jgi:hypothetical protein
MLLPANYWKASPIDALMCHFQGVSSHSYAQRTFHHSLQTHARLNTLHSLTLCGAGFSRDASEYAVHHSQFMWMLSNLLRPLCMGTKKLPLIRLSMDNLYKDRRSQIFVTVKESMVYFASFRNQTMGIELLHSQAFPAVQAWLPTCVNDCQSIHDCQFSGSLRCCIAAAFCARR